MQTLGNAALDLPGPLPVRSLPCGIAPTGTVAHGAITTRAHCDHKPDPSQPQGGFAVESGHIEDHVGHRDRCVAVEHASAQPVEIRVVVVAPRDQLPVELQVGG